MKKYLVPSLLLSLCISVSSVFAQTSTYLDITPAHSGCSITNTLRVGSRDRFTGGDVSRLQKDLKMTPTGFFGELTKTAVQKFQTANLAKSEYYYSSNGRIVNEYGVVNTATRLKLNNMFCTVTTPTEPYACTADAKLCEDGSYVSRTGPGCAFAACPLPTESPIILNTGLSSPLDGSMTMMRESSMSESGSDTLGVPTNPRISISPYKLLFTSTETFKLTWSALNAISYKLKMDGVIKGPFTETELSTTFAALGYTVNGAHWFAIQGCNTSGCGPWSSIVSASIGGVGTGKITPNLYFYVDNAVVYNGASATVKDGTATFRWGANNSVSCTLNGVSVPMVDTSRVFSGLTTGTQTFLCTSSTGVTSQLTFNVVVSKAPVVVTNPTLSLSANGVAVSNGSTVTATGGSASFSWGSTNASSCMLNGLSVQTSGSQTFSGLTTGTRTYSCTSASGGSAMISFNVLVPAPVGGSTTTLPGTPVLSITPYKMLYSFTEPFRLNWSATNATSYKLRVDNVERMTFTDSGYSTNFTTLGFTTRGAHSFQVQACNAVGCGSLSNQIFASIGGAGTAINSLKSTLTVINGAIVSQSEALASSLIGATEASASSGACTNITSNLHRGYETASVSKLQNFLISKGLLSEKASGFFGDLTIEAVKAYQRSLGLTETGMVYDITRQAIREETCQ